MASASNIEWTNFTWNPATGCTKISAGCKFCYAERWAMMHKKRGIPQYNNGFEFTLAKNRLEEPFKIKGNQTIFVNSMSDLFHPDMPNDYLKKVFDVMNKASNHNFQILTKRSNRLMELDRLVTITPNIWIGVSVENEETVYRINDIKNATIPNRFISFEPLIGPISFQKLNGISWVIVGGESGIHSRFIDPMWVSAIKENCSQYDIPFFFKQWGSKKNNPDANDPTLLKGDPFYAMGGCQLEGIVHHNLPQMLIR